MLIPSRLRPGDTIGVITPSAPISSSPSPEPVKELERGINFLEELGFKVVLSEHALGEAGYSAGTAQERAGDINAMFADEDIRAIISSHGGTTINSCLEFLDWGAIAQNPKILMGFSDLTVLLLALYSKVGLVSFHGNMVMWHFGMNPSEYDREEFLDRLVHCRIGAVRKNSAWRTVRGTGSVEGRLFGGHIDQIRLLYGTPYWPDIEDGILFLEFTRYDPDSLDAYFHQMKQMGLFERVRGAVIGHHSSAPPEKEYQAEEILRLVTSRSDFPILRTDDFGHLCPNTVLPVGVRSKLDADSATLEILDPCVE
jgi:muramoyltetrapeptide carboxypeptidase